MSNDADLLDLDCTTISDCIWVLTFDWELPDALWQASVFDMYGGTKLVDFDTYASSDNWRQLRLTLLHEHVMRLDTPRVYYWQLDQLVGGIPHKVLYGNFTTVEVS